jgi:hypothetical protein
VTVAVIVIKTEIFPVFAIFVVFDLKRYLPKPRSAVTSNVRFEVFTAMTMKNADFWDVTQCGSGKNRRFGGTYRHHHQGEKNR